MSGSVHRSYRRVRAFALRSIALHVLVFAVPTTKQVIENAHAIAQGFASAESDCGDDCGEKSSSTPKPCQHCSCCAPRSVVSPLVVAPAAPPCVIALERTSPEDVQAPGFRAPPFRPPAV